MSTFGFIPLRDQSLLKYSVPSPSPEWSPIIRVYRLYIILREKNSNGVGDKKKTAKNLSRMLLFDTNWFLKGLQGAVPLAISSNVLKSDRKSYLNCFSVDSRIDHYSRRFL